MAETSAPEEKSTEGAVAYSIFGQIGSFALRIAVGGIGVVTVFAAGVAFQNYFGLEYFGWEKVSNLKTVASDKRDVVTLTDRIAELERLLNKQLAASSEATQSLEKSAMPNGEKSAAKPKPDPSKSPKTPPAHPGAVATAPDAPPGVATAPPPRPSVSLASIPYEDRRVIENEKIVPVFFATNRKPELEAEIAEIGFQQTHIFEGALAAHEFIDRMWGAKEGVLNYGEIRISIPPDHREGELESPKYWKFEFSLRGFKLIPDPNEHVTLTSVRFLKEINFFNEVKESVKKSSNRDALVFIHGYNVGFVDAVRRTGQIAYDLRFPGAAILFSWPSKDKTALYTHDKDAAAGAAPVLKEFLTDVAERTGATSIHVIAHSMGNLPLTQALHDLAISRPPDAPPIFNEIVLAAPDVRASHFRELAKQFPKTSKRVTMYASKTDKALKASIAANGFPRAGDTTKDIVIVNKLDTIDASNLDTDFLGHSYISNDRIVITDLFYVLMNHLAPNQRKLDSKLWNGQQYWQFSP
jgi:esterase/lipase superfamily enzyme